MSFHRTSYPWELLKFHILNKTMEVQWGLEKRMALFAGNSI